MRIIIFLILPASILLLASCTTLPVSSTKGELEIERMERQQNYFHKGIPF
jgi:hypothetical protein